ncbi:hypothetical protein MIND_00920600 [Mycena indigotica]|uniref:G domain-containing protein n=1 Tax=Mycena indigotica TaxID=2126181 RepID=A0A8H6SDD6_9AGAR|nr:uncharacterized protein MIND_00920600 [Mycena indigotica]KAF7296888.1 hypothetical protein MIND_00920600 [Mycena indigotica]
MSPTPLDANVVFASTVIHPRTDFRLTPESRREEASKISGAEVAKYRVLVAGRLQAGKTTLINTLCGTTCESGQEDIEREFSHERLLLHDSAGYQGVSYNIRLVKTFLDKRGLARTFAERVHAIWYCICTDSGMHLAPGDLHFFDNDIAQQVPVIAVFTRYRGLVTSAYADLRMTLRRVEAKEKRFEKARELLQLEYVAPLQKLRYPPTAFVQIDDLLDETTTLEHLIQTTLALMTGETLRPMVLSVRQTNLDPCMEAAVGAAFDAKEGSGTNTISRLVFCGIILIFGKSVHNLHRLVASAEVQNQNEVRRSFALTDMTVKWCCTDSKSTNVTGSSADDTQYEPPGPARAMVDLNDDYLTRAIATCRSSISRRISDTPTYTKRADLITTLCICIEQTAVEASVSMDDFSDGFNLAADATSASSGKYASCTLDIDLNL